MYHNLVAENMEIGNGYGVPGGGAYYNSARPPMFTSAAVPNVYKPDFNGPTFDRSHSGHFEGSRGVSDGSERFNSVGVKMSARGVIDVQAGALGRDVDQRVVTDLDGIGKKGDLPDFLKEKLQARGILKDGPNNIIQNVVSNSGPTFHQLNLVCAGCLQYQHSVRIYGCLWLYDCV